MVELNRPYVLRAQLLVVGTFDPAAYGDDMPFPTGSSWRRGEVRRRDRASGKEYAYEQDGWESSWLIALEDAPRAWSRRGFVGLLMLSLANLYGVAVMAASSLLVAQVVIKGAAGHEVPHALYAFGVCVLPWAIMASHEDRTHAGVGGEASFRSLFFLVVAMAAGLIVWVLGGSQQTAAVVFISVLGVDFVAAVSLAIVALFSHGEIDDQPPGA